MLVREAKMEEIGHLKLDYRYTTRWFYSVRLDTGTRGWTLRLNISSLPRDAEVHFDGELFAPHVKEPRVFVASNRGEDVGWIEVGYEAWNNRLRVWELLVKEGRRRHGIGTALMRKAKAVAKEVGARMIVLETQSCNVPAIRFYNAQGFNLIGLDTHAYSNHDMERDVVRLEFGLKTGRNGPHRTIHASSRNQYPARRKAVARSS